MKWPMRKTHRATDEFLRERAFQLTGRHRLRNLREATITKLLEGKTAIKNVPDPEMVVEMIGSMAALRRAPRLDDVAEAAAFFASDRAAGMTGSMANVTCGLVLR